MSKSFPSLTNVEPELLNSQENREFSVVEVQGNTDTVGGGDHESYVVLPGARASLFRKGRAITISTMAQIFGCSRPCQGSVSLHEN
jgi:hypothetical protein